MKYSRLQIAFLIIMFSSIPNKYVVLPHLMHEAKRDAWVCIFIAYIFFLLWGLAISFLVNKMEGISLMNFLKLRTGKGITFGLIGFFSLFICISGLISFYELIKLIDLHFLPYTPTWVITISLIILCLASARNGIKTIVYLSVFLLPIVWCLDILNVFASFSDKDYSHLFPVLIQGKEPLIKGTFIILGGTADILLLLFFQHQLRKPYRFLHIILIITAIMGMTIASNISTIASFGPYVATAFNFPAFEQWRLVTLGMYISHVDFLAVFQILSGVMIKVSLCLSCLGQITEEVSKKTKRFAIFLILSIYAIVSISKISEITIKIFINYYLIVAFIAASVLTCVLLLISLLPVKLDKGVKNL
ncbi:spore gernimation protein GerXB [Bacillus pumilus]|uniref:Spore gernimation protein GerXB n=1 Tax=Bacillus pumilus TaxID=1408 RepID=A0A2A5IWG3_BACPU|nr:GerAB/ArcD/ProY family transporter [Bacillus pumilus]PCK21337.1 spore gernimation protein GerXB [Bacillus pumilus]